MQNAASNWEETEIKGTSRAIFSALVDSIASGEDPKSGGAPQLGCLYRIGGGKILGVVNDCKRYYAGSALVGKEDVDRIEWRNSTFERVSGSTKKLVVGAQRQPRPSGI